MMLINIIIIIISYLISSISGAILMCKILQCPDPRKYGSHNPGATNIFRISGLKIAISVLIFDMFKGMIPMWLNIYLEASPLIIGITAMTACIGHIYPVYFQFHGGKGVATAFGVLIVIDPNLIFVTITIWLSVTILSGFSSLASITTAIITPLYVWYYQNSYFIITLIISALIIAQHTQNIKRLWKNQEPKIWNH